MKYFLFLLLMTGAQYSAADERGPQASVKDAGLTTDEDRIFTDADGKPYFPKGRESYYTKYYRAANLPSLQSLRLEKGEIRFRVAFLPSFSKPLFLSYARKKDKGVISVTRLSGSMAQPGTVEMQSAFTLNSEASEGLEKTAARPDVRNPLKALDDQLRPLYALLDGQQWILEVVTNDGYTMVDIQSPESFEHYENEVRAYYEKEVRKNPKKYSLPESFKDYDLPDLDVSAFQTFCEDLLRLAEVSVPSSRGDEAKAKQ